MEETKKSRNDQGGNNKMVIKVGGGGIGAVVLLGGALATAAFASAFVLGQKRLSSGKDRRRNSSPEINEKSENDEATKGQGQEIIDRDQTFHEDEVISKGAKEEVEVEIDSTVTISAHSFKVDGDKARKVEEDPICDEGFVIVKEEIPLLAEKDEKDKVESTKEDVSDDHSKESTNHEQVYVEDESAKIGSDGDGEIDTTNHKEAAEVTQEEKSEVCQEDDIEADNGVEGFPTDQTNVNMEVMEKKEFGGFCNGNEEINEEKYLEPEATERGMVDLSDDGIVVVSESHNKDTVEMVQVDEDKVEYIEEKTVNGCIDRHPSPENIISVVGELGEDAESLEVCEDKASMQFDAKKNVEKEVEEDLIAPQDVETLKHGENEDKNRAFLVQYPDSHPEENKDDVKRESEKEVEEEELIDDETVSDMVNGEEVSRKDSDGVVDEGAEVIVKKSSVHTSAAIESVIMDYGGDRAKDLNDKAAAAAALCDEESSGESKWEALWQAEWAKKASSVAPQRVKLMEYEVGGKIQEDKAVEKKDDDDDTMNSTRRRPRMMMWMVCVVSVLSCSCFFRLSLAKLCLVVFLTVFLLEIYGYPLMNRQQPQCLQAAERRNYSSSKGQATN